MEPTMTLILGEGADTAYAESLAAELSLAVGKDDGADCLLLDGEGLSYRHGGQILRGDFNRMANRLRPANLKSEMLVRACTFKDKKEGVRVLDATAGLGEDSFLLAAAGFEVDLYERDPIIAALLEDALRRASEDTDLCRTAARMHFHAEDSIGAMPRLSEAPDVVYLDPMFPARQKSGLVKKKFQVLHGLEEPCTDGEALLEAALGVGAKRIVIKRPLKSEALAGRKPSYSLEGKAIRYDCVVPAAK